MLQSHLFSAIGENRTLICISLKASGHPVGDEGIMPVVVKVTGGTCIINYLRLPAAVLLLLRHVKRWLLTIVVRCVTILWLANWLLLAVVTIPLSRNPLMLMVMIEVRLTTRIVIFPFVLTSPSLSYRGSLLDSILNINLRPILLHLVLRVLSVSLRPNHLGSIALPKSTTTHEQTKQTQLHNHTSCTKHTFSKTRNEGPLAQSVKRSSIKSQS